MPGKNYTLNNITENIYYNLKYTLNKNNINQEMMDMLILIL